MQEFLAKHAVFTVVSHAMGSAMGSGLECAKRSLAVLAGESPD